MKKILFASFESLPFVKTGGLADVIYSLPLAIDPKQYEVKVVLPLLKSIKDKYISNLKPIGHIYINQGFINEEANILSYVNQGIEYFFIENDTYFYRDGVYGYDDDVSRFAFYNLSILEMMINLNYYPDIIHEHDYHVACISALCKIKYNAIEQIAKIKHIFTIHNLAYQGIYDKQVLFNLFGFDYHYFENGDLRFNDCANLMKIGLIFADYITTVSETYAHEILTSQYGEGLDSILNYRNDNLVGITNGIDINIFNPKTDKYVHNYDLRSIKSGKKINKLKLQEKLGLVQDEEVLLVGIVSRLTWQKGLDLVIESLAEILNKEVQVAVLGTGESRYEYSLKTMENNHKGQAVFYCGYNEELANLMYAGLDLLLMPSLFEPCGLSQMIAMRYGTLPLVRETGGLKDTVQAYNCYDNSGNGFSFYHYQASDLLTVFNIAYDLYYADRKVFEILRKNAMKTDVSFKASALKYQTLYDKVLNG